MSMKWENKIGIAKAAAGSPLVLTDPYYFGVSDFTADHTGEFSRSDVANGGRDFHRTDLLGQNLAGSITVDGDAEILGYLLAWAMVKPVSSELVANEYGHTYTPDLAALQEFYIREKRGSAADKVIGPCKINTLTLSAAKLEKLVAVAQYVARGIADAGSHPAEGYPDLLVHPFLFRNLEVLSCEHGESLVPDLTIEGFTLALANGLDTGKRVSNQSAFQSAFKEGKREITGTFMAEFEDETTYDRLFAETEMALRLTFTGTNMGTNDYSLQIDLPRVKLENHDRGGASGGGNERQVATLGFTALYEDSEDAAILAILQNSNAGTTY